MLSHYDCIGLPADDEEALEAHMRRAADDATAVVTDAGTYLHWTSDSGAELWVQVDQADTVVGVHPHFAGKGALPVGVLATVMHPEGSPLEGGYHCWANPSPDDLAGGDYPFVFDAPDFHTRAPGLVLPSRGTVQLAAFAEHLKTWASADAYAESGDDEPRLAVESFIPTGLFGDETEERVQGARALITGVVVESAWRVNPLSQACFVWALVRTYGSTLDVVIDPRDAAEGIRPGMVLQGTFWLSGRLSL